MLEFLVLGRIPGTNLQINFYLIFDLLIAALVIVLTPRVLRYAEQRKQASR